MVDLYADLYPTKKHPLFNDFEQYLIDSFEDSIYYRVKSVMREDYLVGPSVRDAFYGQEEAEKNNGTNTA